MPNAREENELDRLEEFIDNWFVDQLDENPVIDSVEREAGDSRRWFVRMRGDEKDFVTIRLHLQQRTLAYETYVMPAPEENHAELYAYLLRRNGKLFGASFGIGDEEGIFLSGALHNDLIETEGELDRVIGSLYVWVEQFFPSAIRIGFASKFS